MYQTKIRIYVLVTKLQNCSTGKSILLDVCNLHRDIERFGRNLVVALWVPFLDHSL